MRSNSVTPGNWHTACDSYGKVQHSRKYDCVFTVVNNGKGEQLITVAARIQNDADARLIEAAPRLLRFVENLAVENSYAGASARELLARMNSSHADKWDKVDTRAL